MNSVTILTVPSVKSGSRTKMRIGQLTMLTVGSEPLKLPRWLTATDRMGNGSLTLDTPGSRYL